LFVADRLYDMLIDSIFQSRYFCPCTDSHSGTRIDIRPYLVERWACCLCRLWVKSFWLKIWCKIEQFVAFFYSFIANLACFLNLRKILPI